MQIVLRENDVQNLQSESVAVLRIERISLLSRLNDRVEHVVHERFGVFFVEKGQILDGESGLLFLQFTFDESSGVESLGT